MKIYRSILAPCALAALVTIIHPLPTLHAQGSLTPPPGAPAPTMLTLSQIEPRTPITSLPFTITNSGSYYLTTNLTGVSGTNGITVAADNVTIDLRGFTLEGVPGALDGIYIPGDQTYLNLALQNGTVSDWPGNGVNADSTQGSQFSQLNLTDNGVDGLDPGLDALVHHCIAVGNGQDGFGGANDNHCTFDSCTASDDGDAGFWTFSFCLFVNCHAHDNGNNGFDLDYQCTTRDCTSDYNSGNGYAMDYLGCVLDNCVCANDDIGILVGDHGTVRGCNATYNNSDGINAGPDSTLESSTAGYNQGQGINVGADSTIIGCASSGNSGASSVGILAGDGCLVKDCAAAGNPLNGIVVTNACSLEHNVCQANGGGGATDGGILCNGNENRIDGNHFTDNNGNGLFLAGTNNTVICNSAKGNTTNYSVGSGNDVGPIGSAAASTSPWANLQ